MNYDGLEPVAAWQPLYAPSFQDSLWNFRSAFATVGAAPTFNPATGWTCNGTTVLNTGLFQSATYWTMLCRFSGADDGYLFGAYNNDNQMTGVRPNPLYTPIVFANASSYKIGGSKHPHGVIGLANRDLYINGAKIDTCNAVSLMPALQIAIGRMNGFAVGVSGNIQTFVIYDTILTPAQIWQRYHMMMHLENPDWNAWAPARQWFFAPSAAAALWAGVGRNSSPVGGSLGVRQ